MHKSKEIYNNLNSNKENNDDLQLNEKYVQALFSYNSTQDTDLSFEKGDILIVESDISKPWWNAKHLRTNRRGCIPSNYFMEDSGSPESLQCWFEISRTKCELQLTRPGYPEGTFMLRRSEDKKHCVISIRCFNVLLNSFSVKHYKVNEVNKGEYFISPKNKFKPFWSLIVYYSKHADGLCHRLNKPFSADYRGTLDFNEIEVNRRLVKLQKKLGSGSFGEVWLATLNDTVNVAVKMVKRDLFDEAKRRELLVEAELMHRLSHPRVVDIIAVCTQPPDSPVFILTEYMSHGVLVSYLNHCKKKKKIHLKDMLVMMTQIIEAMVYLGSKGVVHRDLRAANILVDDDISLKVTDFGLAQIDGVIHPSMAEKFPKKWTSPEGGLYKRFSVKSDVWSFGVVMYEIVTYGRAPYEDLEGRDMFMELINGYRLSNPHGGRIICPPELYAIMKSCWEYSADERPTFEELSDRIETYSQSVGILKT